MSFKITIKEVSIEKVKKGKANYDKAVVAYDYQGEARTQTLVSFSNPGVFAVVQELKAGDIVSVETTKNGEYTNWSKLEVVGNGDSVPVARTAASVGTPVKSVSTYETPQERADNRVRIVRQSSLSNAIATLSKISETWTEQDAMRLAQEYFDWVYAEDQNKSPE